MRKSYDAKVIYDDEKKLVGINLGADYTSEHEWGIDGIQQAFGVNTSLDGINKRIVTKSSESLYFFDYRGHSYLILEKHTKGPAKIPEDFECSLSELDPGYPSERGDGNKFNMVCAWDSSSFGICMPKKHRGVLAELYRAFSQKDVAVWVGGGGVFQNGGLILVIVSNLDEKYKDEILKEDLDHKRLIKAAKDTGIEEILTKAGKRWMALSPKWKSESEGYKSKYEVIFWLNPMQQNIHNYGWFTVEDLKLWAKDKGPIPMKKG